MRIYPNRGRDPFIILRKSTWAFDFIRVGWGNGYVALPEWHKWYEVHYDNIPVIIHGGLTYSQIEKIKKKNYWVIGFDTCHLDDNLDKWPRYKVKEEAEELLKQCLNEDNS